MNIVLIGVVRKDLSYIVAHASHEAMQPLLDRAATLSVTQLEPVLHEDDAALADQIVALNEIPMMHGAGISRRLLVTGREQSLPIFNLCLYTAEGGESESEEGDGRTQI